MYQLVPLCRENSKDRKIIANQMTHLIKAFCVEINYDVINNNLVVAAPCNGTTAESNNETSS